MVPTEEFSRKHLLITGRVQGVGYRYSMQRKARSLGLAGWCRNLKDGHVEAEVYGLTDAVEALIQWCYEGPAHAEVTDISAQQLPVEGIIPPETFEIRL